MASDYDELSKKTEESVANALKKTAAVTKGSIKGVTSTVNDATSGLPRWAKITLVVVAILVVLWMLGV